METITETEVKPSRKRVSSTARSGRGSFFTVLADDLRDCLSIISMVPVARVREHNEFCEAIVESDGKMVIRFVGDQGVRASVSTNVKTQELTDRERVFYLPVKRLLSVMAKFPDDAVMDFEVENSGLRLRCLSVKILIEVPAIAEYGYDAGQRDRITSAAHCALTVDPRSLATIVGGCRGTELESFREYDVQCIGMWFDTVKNELQVAVADQSKVLYAKTHADLVGSSVNDKGVLPRAAIYSTTATVIQKMCNRMNVCNLTFSASHFVIEGDVISIEMPTSTANLVPFDTVLRKLPQTKAFLKSGAQAFRDGLDVLLPMIKEDQVLFHINTNADTSECMLFLHSKAAEVDIVAEVLESKDETFDVRSLRRLTNVYKKEDVLVFSQAASGSPIYIRCEDSPFLAVIAASASV